LPARIQRRGSGVFEPPRTRPNRAIARTHVAGNVFAKRSRLCRRIV